MKSSFTSADISLERGAGAPIGRYSQLLSLTPTGGVPAEDADEDIDSSGSTTSDGGGNIYNWFSLVVVLGGRIGVVLLLVVLPLLGMVISSSCSS